MAKFVIPEACMACDKFDGKIGCDQARDFLNCIKECPKDGHSVAVEALHKPKLRDVSVSPVGSVGRISMGAWQFP